ncbi:ankyrin repeat protein [Lasiosphaeria hispida]|uniref:Ankyrin repeat protein n=1 Tax=Lasiosphaeria hispida TaxID=260671 RepID=A0AAJ0M7L2_9PEZI|nr:ankyrin repeat protein [Lasiosphaeria hispida]
MQRLSSRNEYTIGWVCALPHERTAAIAMLDVEHSRPRDFAQLNADTNSYAWGHISTTSGVHNVVIASLPTGIYGTSSAASTAAMMLMSFPKVRFGLMVGIGAGIPRDGGPDIRLGDVAVSKPVGTSGGVVQYDFVKALQDGQLQRIGSLNNPPMVLLNAVTAIRGQPQSRVSHYLAEMLRKPHIQNPPQGGRSYSSPGPNRDVLFPDTYKHRVPGADCSSCDSKIQVIRSPRNSTDPQVHYGVIASGNAVVKDAAARNRFVQQTGADCICFEMEAAGLMNSFPCLVIRGICDYADAHKNDDWQGYAAAVAAAYAKDLLHYVPLQAVNKGSRPRHL